MSENDQMLRNIIEAALLAAEKPLSIDQIIKLFSEREQPDRKSVKQMLCDLQEDYRDRAIEVVEVGSGWRIQVKKEYSSWISRLWNERPTRYSRALLETLALIAYRQPITRGEIEDVRGVAVSSSIINTLKEREWVQVIGHRDVPGRPALYATTRTFLDYFNLKKLSELPKLPEIKELSELKLPLEEAIEESQKVVDPQHQQG